MRSGKIAFLAVLAAGLVGLSMAADSKDKPKTIKQIMKTGHDAPEGQDPLCKKFLTGKASSDEVKTLIILYTDLGKNKPPKGDADVWKDKTTALLAAAKALAAKDEGAAAKYKEAVSCKGCHEVFKPKAKK